MPSAVDFERSLRDIIAKAEALGLVAIDVKSGNLHRRVGGYPESNHQMPTCCEVIYGFMKSGDEIVSQPPSGRGASVVVRFKLPR